MSTITLEEAQARLPELIAGLKPGEELVITQQGQPIARLVAERPATRKPRVPGTARGKILYMAEDFNAPLEDFKEYME